MSEDILEKQLFEIIRNKDLSEDIKLAKIDMLNKLGVKVNAMYGAWTPLHIAKKQKEPKVIEFLTKIGAIDVVDDKKRKSLCYKLRNDICIKGGDINEVKELIDMGVDVNQKDNSGRTALMEASYWGYKEVVELLIQNGADVNQKDEKGKTALVKASGEGYKEIVELLIKNGADVNHKDNYGYTALMDASYWGYKEVVELLIQSGADVNQKNDNDVTALMMASRRGYKEIVELLIENGADVNQKDNNGETVKTLAKDKETRKAIINAVKKRNKEENGGSFFSKIIKGLEVDR
ncbi:MAG: ankyrin repeat domain-containing protein [Alphaproteobacteria bacterium]|nr:ankyrin repeat domain-containing protein [Alphaproteobacteria bacterium]